MPLQAGFAAADITPSPGTGKIGWMEDLRCEEFLDPLSARIAVFDDGTARVGFVQLDTLCVRWTTVDEMRRQIESAHGFPGASVMVAATHSHAGPAVANCWPVKRDEAYVEWLVDACVEAFGRALADMQEAEIGLNHMFEFDVGFNRRVVLRDGTVRTQSFFGSTPEALCLEGPIDPEVAVIGVRAVGGAPLGCLVNFACHPVHHGAGSEVSGGFPALVCRQLREAGWPVTVYLNGAYGNVVTFDYERGTRLTKEEAAERITADVLRATEDMRYDAECDLGAATTTVEVPYREITPEEYHGTVRGAQRFRSDEIYEGAIDALIEKTKREGTQKAEVQVLRLGDAFLASAPAEYFVELGLDIKERTHPRRALVVGGANGMLGYVPTREAYSRGGYETTLGPPSRLAPGCGETIADAAVELIRKM